MSGRLDLPAALAALAEQRPVFHSEADFQFALAWVIRKRHPGIEVRLEYPAPWDGPRSYIDVWLRNGDGPNPVELKYWTSKTELTFADETFDLKQQGAQDQGRYDFWKDVERIERLIASGLTTGGYVVALTNDRGYWNEGREGTIDGAFRMHAGRVVQGTLSWSPHASAGSIKGRESPIDLSGGYVTHWHHYSQPAEGPGGEFRYLLLDVGTALGAS